ncbi:hypothetical protein AKJ65_07550 [candidate division MSBL1 archaeon SCGC-AAA259E19]|uniref:histidine kinase n=1 Tax=candidate division MSBL1 archaeon SCGC-AAA259E19 TaxID=1698264 RepID=A0A133UE30_9EURY|nr:hypothetical protein AKJ65_07550 [candidate division MSBL1 archaeon SCGC-AAA259E19]
MNESSFSQRALGELSALHEISSLSLLRDESELARMSREKAWRILDVQKFALMKGPEGDRRIITSFGFRNEENIENNLKENEENGFCMTLGENGELGKVYFEKDTPVKGRERRIFRLFSLRLEESLATQKEIKERQNAEERREFLHFLLRHDLRNKIQALQGYNELLKDFDLPREAEKYVEKSVQTIKNSNDLIEKVSILQEMDEEKETKKLNVGKLIRSVIEKRKTQALEESIEIEHDGVDCRAKGGPLLEELFSNLLENSIRHANCSKIRIGKEETENECIIKVEDDGHGIPNGEKEKIFEKGFHSGKTGGSGLGMYLVQQIAENYEGRVEVKDSELGGARFDVHLQKM